jgi:hypothetical protein
VGHGFCIYADSIGWREHLVAFVEGFAWRCGANKAVVRFDPQLMPAGEQQFAALKAAIEARIRAGNVSPSEIVPGFSGIANA